MDQTRPWSICDKIYVMENKDFSNMTLRDMEEYIPKGRRTGKERARNMSIKYKIGTITFLVALIPMVVLTILMLFFYNRAIMQRAEKQIEENIRIMSDRIYSVLQNGEVCSNNLTIEFGNYYNDKSMKQVTRDNKITSQLSQSLLIYNGISSIVFIDNNGRFYSTDPSFNSDSAKIKYSQYVYSLKDLNGKTIMMDPTENPFDKEDKEVITLGKHVINIASGSHLGYLFINMNKDYLIESSQSEISYYFLYDENGNPIIETEKKDEIYKDKELIDSLFSTEPNFIKYNRESYLLAKDIIDEYHWTVVGITNLNKFNVTGRELRFILFTTGSFIAILLLVAVGFYSYLVTKPLAILHDGAEQIAEGDMRVRFRFRTKDEIGRLGRIFNYMTQRNLELLQRVDDEAKKKREYELALVQEQVKPHFLYNTLDIIIMLIEMKRTKEASRVTHKLASYYKNSLSGSDEIVTIEREIQIIRDYLDLQTMRYGDKFTYNLDVDESVFDSQIPKMTLQPLVENAIYHGIKNKTGSGIITVSGRKLSPDENSEIKSDYVELMVSDDGIGMPSDELSKLNDLLGKENSFENEEKKKEREAEITDHDSTKGGSHFGLYSVAKRIRLYFGAEYGARIESTEGVGTKVIVTLPL